MTESLTGALVGILLICLGIVNIQGNISTIHWYNRTRITEETRLPYGRCVGSGCVIIGAGCVLTAALEWFFGGEWVYIILILTLVVGLSLILYGQMKYNKGIF